MAKSVHDKLVVQLRVRYELTVCLFHLDFVFNFFNVVIHSFTTYLFILLIHRLATLPSHRSVNLYKWH